MIEYVRVGRIVGVHGINGRLKIFVITDIYDRFDVGNTLLFQIDSEYKEYTVQEFIQQKAKTSLLKVTGIDDRDTGLALKGVEIYIDKRTAEETRDLLGSDNFYFYEIIGCEVYYNNRLFGAVVDIIESGENSVLIIKDKQGKEALIPFIESMVDTAKIFSKRIDISPIEGLLE